MSDVVIAYMPVLHDGYRRFLERHATSKPLFVIGPSLYLDYRPLAKDIRCLDADRVAAAVRSWDICASVAVLAEEEAAKLAARRPSIALPAEDISYQLVERFFPRSEVFYDTVFLRWDKTRTAQLLEPQAARRVCSDIAAVELGFKAEAAAQTSVDWWRQVGAAIRFASGETRWATNVQNPHQLSAYAVGDPRSNFHKGVHLELSTVTHAEASLIADAARGGTPTAGAVMYVTDFPCPPCAKLIAGAGVQQLYFRSGYAVLDGEDVLAAAGIEIVQVA